MGEPVSRVEGVDKVTGRARYTADVVIPGLLHAVLVQTQIPHGHVIEQSLRHTADRVSRAPGVLHVLTPMNCPALQQLPRELTFDLPLERRPPLSDLTVQYVGQHLAVVVAIAIPLCKPLVVPVEPRRPPEDRGVAAEVEQEV